MRPPVRLFACVFVIVVGCNDAESKARIADQAEVEAEFGRRPGGVVAGAEAERPPTEDSPDAEDPAGAPGEAPAGDRSLEPTEDEPQDEADPSPREAEPVVAPDVPGAMADSVVDPENAPPAVASGPSSSGVDVDSLLAAAEVAYDRITSLRASFVQRMEIPLLDRVSEGRGMWYQRGSGHFRMEFADPAGDILVADGTHFWAYQPSQQPDQVIKSQLGGGAEAGTVDVLGQILSEARTRYASVDDGVESVAGVSTHVVTLTPLGPSRYRSVRVWIAATDGLVRRFRIEEENESIRTVTLSALEPQVPLDDALFRFTPPPGVQTFEG